MARTPKKSRKRKIRQAEIVALFATKLRELRRSRGMSQAALAAGANVSVPYVGRLERGETAPGIDLLGRLATALGAGPAELLPTEPGDPDEVLRRRISELMESILRQADRETLLMLAPWLSTVEDALSRRR